MGRILSSVIEETNNRTDKHTLHSYFKNFYDLEFSKFEHGSVTLIEIGVWLGYSIQLWYEYFRQAEIYGLDNKVYSQEFQEWCNTHSNIHYIIDDAYTSKLVNTLPNYDICIDDGPHTLESQLVGLELYLPKMKTDGMYIIEDVQEYDHLNILQECVTNLFPDLLCEQLDFRSAKNRYDDIILVVRRK